MLRFPAGFHWGAATAAYQIEGAWQAHGKGESIWDRFSHTPGRIRDGDTGDVACDSYHRFGEDVALLREMGLSSYRFSLSWPRIQPDGRGRPSAAGLDYYSRLIDALLEAGIRPFPTLYHWDLPQALEDAGGWPERALAGWFAEYAALVARALGDRAKGWMLFNEPQIFTGFGYALGIHAPGRKEPDAFLRATHVVNLAQGEAFRAMRAERQELSIGTALNMAPVEPATPSPEDADAALRWHRFANEWFLRPALRGEYPDAYPEGVPAAVMNIGSGDLDRVRADFDFIGINLYTRAVVKAVPRERDPFGLGVRIVGGVGGDKGPRTDFGWEVWPDSLYRMLVRISTDYDRPALEITENGCSYADGPDANGVVHDARRIAFYRGYLEAMHRAIAEGADVRGYHAWSLLDNFEWTEGYAQRFGLVWVDHATGRRILKESGRWYGGVARANALTG